MGLRNPKALRASSLISRLMPSLAALVMPVRMNASIWGHHGLDGGGEAVQFRDGGVGAPPVERPQPGRDLVARRVGAGQRQQRAQFLLGDPGGQNVLPGPAEVDQPVPHVGELLVGQIFAVAQQPAPDPVLGIVLADPAAAQRLVTRRRTLATISLASCTTWKWSTTRAAFGRCSRTAAR